VSFSESAWTINKNLPTGKITAFGAKLEGLLNKQVKLAEPTLATASLFINSEAINLHPSTQGLNAPYVG
jgi:hypothetical protein